jgi:hypothetical protein
MNQRQLLKIEKNAIRNSSPAKTNLEQLNVHRRTTNNGGGSTERMGTHTHGASTNNQLAVQSVRQTTAAERHGTQSVIYEHTH